MIFKNFLFSLLIILSFSNKAVCQDPHEEALSDTSNYRIRYLPFNSTANDYHAVPYRGGIVFCTSRDRGWGIVYSGTSGNTFTDYYYSEPNSNGHWSKAKKFSTTLNSKLNEGPFCFNENGNIIYYTSNGEVENKDNKTLKLKIYKAELINNTWTKFEPFIFNNENYGIGHPSLSKDGKMLFFASDMPGGYGGSDIYVTYLQKGRWSKPVNLGNHINTKEDEVFPFINSDGTLYFSSKGHLGKGNLDIYSSQLINSEWKNVKNLETPLNSQYDDFSYVMSGPNTGYFSSNRENGKTDNIYSFQSLKPNCDTLKKIISCFTFFEEATKPDEKTSLAYEWDLGDGTKARGLEVTHCFAHEGTFKVNLNMIDTITNQIFFNESSYELLVEGVKSPYFEYTDSLFINKNILFDGRKSKIPGGKIKEYVWDLGDGTTAIGPSVTHSYKHKGHYEINLMVRGKDSLGFDVERCVFQELVIKDSSILSSNPSKDSLQKISKIATTVFSVAGDTSIRYAIEVKSSEVPIPIKPENFKGLKDISEFRDQGTYRYTTGEGRNLEEMYPLYQDVKIRGFDHPQVVALKNDKIISAQDTNRRFLLNGKTYTHITGRVINRFGDPLPAMVVLENLSTGKIILTFKNDPENGKFELELPNGVIYGYYAEKDSFYSISNFIDLRNEKRNLEVKKNIEMIRLVDLDENNLTLRINNLFFESNQFKISPESFPELKRIATMILNEPDLIVEISGHSDNVGSEEKNLDLSQRRAESVREHLLKLGCDKKKLVAKGYGSSKPLVSNQTDRGRYLNRRVEIKFIKN